MYIYIYKHKPECNAGGNVASNVRLVLTVSTFEQASPSLLMNGRLLTETHREPLDV